MKKLFLLIFILILNVAQAQQWGLYTLYSMKGGSKAYLIDTSGNIYKTWTFGTNQKTSFSSYLIPGDTLVRSVSYPGNIITGGPVSGEIQKVDWNGSIVWDYIYSDSTQVLHHDICPMPNGNVLMICLDIKTIPASVQAGSSVNNKRRSEKIMEVNPTGANTGTIVWEWNVWDHLCQNHDSAKNNYVTSIAENPQLIDLNYDIIPDFIHLNGLDYNASLDQIAFSALQYSEVYVIDHSTTTAEAAGHTGGNSGHGGDILYRWGNPAAYGVPGTTDFDGAHDAHWIPADNPYYPGYLCGFNNTGGEGGKSSVDIFNPPYAGYNYSYTPGTAYDPATYAWRYTDPSTTTTEGGSQQLSNGNTLVCMSFCDTIREVDHSGNLLWTFATGGGVSNAVRYSKCFVRGPVASAGASSLQIVSGTPVTLNSSAVSVTESSPVYTYSWSSVPAGFSSSSQNPVATPWSTTTYFVTITNTDIGCSDTASVTVQVGNGINEHSELNGFNLYPDPVSDVLNIAQTGNSRDDTDIRIYNMMGQVVYNHNFQPQAEMMIDVSKLNAGVYSLEIKSENRLFIKKFIKR
jgi:hypothetical protein